MSRIADVHAREILDSRGNPTVEVEVSVRRNGRAAVPSGASTGVHEAIELRDGGEAFGGKGVTKAVANVNGETWGRPRHQGRRAEGARRELIELDGTPNKGRLGANAILGVSLAVARAAARSGPAALPLPRRQARGAARADDERDQRRRARGELDRPSGVHARPGRRADVRGGAAHRRRGVPRAQVPAEERLTIAVGDEGGFAPHLASSEEAIEAILAAAERAGHREKVAIALDPAPSEFFDNGGYPFEGRRSPAEIADFYAGLVAASRSSRSRTASPKTTGTAGSSRQPLGDRVQLVGDDIFVTNPERLQRGIDRGVANSILDQGKPDRHADRDVRGGEARARNGYSSVISHRSGETEDATIADLAVASTPGRSRPGAFSLGARRQVQPAAPDRVRARQRRGVPGLGGVPAREGSRPRRAAGTLAAWCRIAGRRSSRRSDRRRTRSSSCVRSSPPAWTPRGSTSRTARTRSTRSAPRASARWRTSSAARSP